MSSVLGQGSVEQVHGCPVLNLAIWCHLPTHNLPEARLHDNGKRANHRGDSSELCPGSEVTSCATLSHTSIYDIPKGSSEPWYILDKWVGSSMKSLHGTEGAVAQSL